MQTSTPAPRNEPLKILGVGFGIAVTIGATIGTGILRKPGPIAAQLGDAWLIMGLWLLVSLYALLGTLCTIELGTSVPRAWAWAWCVRTRSGPLVATRVLWWGSIAGLAPARRWVSGCTP